MEQFIRSVDYLEALAEEIKCRTDPDLAFVDSMVFFGLARTGWVEYVDCITVVLRFPKWEKIEKIRLDDPKSFQRMEKIFHDNSWDYFK